MRRALGAAPQSLALSCTARLTRHSARTQSTVGPALSAWPLGYPQGHQGAPGAVLLQSHLTGGNSEVSGSGAQPPGCTTAQEGEVNETGR